MGHNRNRSIVYVATCELGTKVGITKDAEARGKHLRAWYGADMKIVRTWMRPGEAGAVEWVARQLLKPHLVRGQELFSLPLDDVVATVERALALVDAKDFSMFKRRHMPRWLRKYRPAEGFHGWVNRQMGLD